jgi:hypothetical protein
MFSVRLPFDLGELLLTPQWGGLHPAVQASLALLICIVPLALVLWLYRWEARAVPRRTAAALLSLRVGLLVVILVLVCLQPMYARTRTQAAPGTILVAVDCSGSMHVADPQRPPRTKLRLARALRLAADICPDELLARWVDDYETSGGPRWLAPDEQPPTPKARRELEARRREVHDEVCARVDRLTRSEAARRVVSDDGLGLLSALARNGHHVELVGFHQDIMQVPTGRAADLFGQPAGPSNGGHTLPAGLGLSARTDLKVPLLRAGQQPAALGQGEVLGVVLVSDGQHNTGPSPTEAARRLGEQHIGIYPVALGDRRPPPDAAVLALVSPPAVFKNAEVPVAVQVRVSALPAQDVAVELFRMDKDRKLLASRTVRHDGTDRVYSHTFPVRMGETGTQTLEARVRPLDPRTTEVCTENNRCSTTIQVSDDKARVLLVDGEARWEYRYLASALRRDPTIELETVVFDQPRLDPGRPAEELREMGSPRQDLPASPDATMALDCIILGDVAPDQLALPQRTQLERYVADGGGTLVVVAGKRFMPLAYAGTGPADQADPLRKLLPIDGSRVVAPADGFGVSLTQAGRDTHFMQLDSEAAQGDEIWAGLQRHFWGVVGTAKPGATALASFTPAPETKASAEHQRRNALMAWHHYGLGRVLFVGLDSTWRWRFKVGELYHHRFWGAAVRWAASDKPLMAGNAFVRFGTPRPVYAPADEVPVVVRLNEALGPVRTGLLAGARILTRTGVGNGDKAVALVPLSADPGQPRVLEGRIRGLVPGRYDLELVIPELADKLQESQRPDHAPRPLRARFMVRAPPSPEMIDLQARWPLLEELAARSGGKFFAAEDAGRLVELLAPKTVTHVEHHEQRLWQWWVVLAGMLTLLTLEWAGRKLAGLP